MQQPKRLFSGGHTLGIILIKGIVKIVMRKRVDADRIRTELLNITEPAFVGLLVNGKVRGVLTRHACTKVYAAYFERDVLAIPLHIDGILVCLHKGSDRCVGMKINIYAQIIIRIETCKQKRNDKAGGKDELFHSQPPSSACSMIIDLIARWMRILLEGINISIQPVPAFDQPILQLRDRFLHAVHVSIFRFER